MGEGHDEGVLSAYREDANNQLWIARFPAVASSALCRTLYQVILQSGGNMAKTGAHWRSSGAKRGNGDKRLRRSSGAKRECADKKLHRSSSESRDRAAEKFHGEYVVDRSARCGDRLFHSFAAPGEIARGHARCGRDRRGAGGRRARLRITYREALWKAEKPGEKRLVLKLFTPSMNWRASMEMLVGRSVQLSTGAGGFPVIAYSIAHRRPRPGDPA